MARKSRVVEHFLGIVHIHEIDASSLTQSLLSFLNDRGICLDGLCGIGFNGTNTMSGERSRVQK